MKGNETLELLKKVSLIVKNNQYKNERGQYE